MPLAFESHINLSEICPKDNKAFPKIVPSKRKIDGEKHERSQKQALNCFPAPYFGLDLLQNQLTLRSAV